MTARFVISLDFELMWGVRDHRSLADYGDAVLGARRAIPRLLRTFRSSGVVATWATVGLLFARNQREMVEFMPSIRPTYENPALDPYNQVRELAGTDESSAPHFFGRSLVDQIRESEGQELACHTYSHYFCCEPGQTIEQFEADLASNVAIAAHAGCTLESLVFCRNQWSSPHVRAARRSGFTAFRGNQRGSLYRSRSGTENTPTIRALRLVDGVIPLQPSTIFDVHVVMNLINVPASRFLRPWSPRTAIYNRLYAARIKREMTQAARTGRNYHLWWHPHNMGRHQDGNFDQLQSILDHFNGLANEYGMISSTMADAAAAHVVQVGSSI